MPGLESTIGKLISSRRSWESLVTGGLMSAGEPEAPTMLRRIEDFGTNPGELRMLVHVPKSLPPGAPLVVVAHGCTQTAAGYDAGSGWSALAERHGFAVLYPEQVRANNANLCFNWFQPEDVRRGEGEVASVRQMVGWMVTNHGLDPRRVFITGLSAGGALTAAMLATYPEVFAAGAIIAGLPYGCATTTQEALEAMFHGRSLAAREWGDLVRRASPHAGPWPHVAIWHGSADTTVIPANAMESVKQWTDVHGLPEAPYSETAAEGCVQRVWRGPDGAPLVSSFIVPGMGHGTPIDPDSEVAGRRYGAAGPHLLDVGVASTVMIASAWGLLRDTPDRRVAQPAGPRPDRPAIDPAAIITRALRAAGLL